MKTGVGLAGEAARDASPAMDFGSPPRQTWWLPPWGDHIDPLETDEPSPPIKPFRPVRGSHPRHSSNVMFVTSASRGLSVS